METGRSEPLGWPWALLLSALAAAVCLGGCTTGSPISPVYTRPIERLSATGIEVGGDQMTCAVGTASTTAKCEHALMPRPRTERQALEQERDVELPAQLADYRRELDTTPPRSENGGNGSSGRSGGRRNDWRRLRLG